MDIVNRVNSLIDIASNLASLLEKENTALRRRKSGDVTSLLEEKNTLTRAYEGRVEGLDELLNNAEAANQLDPELRQRIRKIGEKLNTLVEENAMLLKVAIEANQRIVDIVADAVKKAQPGPGTYSSKGSVEKDRTGTITRNVAFSLDRQL